MSYNLNKYLKARRPIIWCNSSDYKEIDSLLIDSTKNIKNKKIYEYRALGVIDFYSKNIKNEITFLYEFLDLIYQEGYDKEIFLLIKNVNLEIDKPEVLAYLKKIAELKYSDRLYNFTTIIVSDYKEVPKELEKYTTIYKIPKMNEKEIEKYIIDFSILNKVQVYKEELEEISNSLKGLTKLEIEHILYMVIENENKISLEEKNIIIKEKGEIIKKSSKLELIENNKKIENVGGMNNLKIYLKKKLSLLKDIEKTKSYGLNIPKGILISGMPGCGKTLISKAAQNYLNVPLIKFNISSFIENNLYLTQKNIKKALRTAELTSPCILLLDEIENFYNINKECKLLFEEFLIWLEEKESPVYVIGTINEPSRFSQEVLKKEKFDDLFFIDFPTEKERIEIFKIYLKKRDEKYLKIDLSNISKLTEGYSGKDIEKIIENTFEKLYLENKEVNENSIIEEIKEKMSSYIRFKNEVIVIKDIFKNINIKYA